MINLMVAGLHIKYGARVVVENFSTSIDAGEAVALMGPSGSGKSSILNCIVGLQQPNSGRILIQDQDLTAAKSESRSRIRRELIGVAFQDPALLPELSIEQNVAITELFDGVPRAKALAHARDSLGRVGMRDHAAKRTDEVSGGEAQRVSLARALVREAAVLLVADEPTASLDAVNARKIGRLIVDQVKQRNIAALVATHDERVALLCDRIVDLRAGR